MSSSRSVRRMRSRGSSATSGSSSTRMECPSSTARRCSPHILVCFSAAMPRGDLRTSSGRWSTVTKRRSRSTITARAFPRMIGLHAWSYSNDYSPLPRTKMQHAELTKRFAGLGVEVELGFTAEQTAKEVERCLNCDVQTHFTDSLCIECDACVDVCPVNCLTITPDAPPDFD